MNDFEFCLFQVGHIGIGLIEQFLQDTPHCYTVAVVMSVMFLLCYVD